MELAILGLLVLLPIASVLPAWQRMGREASNARLLITDVGVLVGAGDHERALSVLEQGASRLASTLKGAILTTNRAELPLECHLHMPVAKRAAAIYRTMGAIVAIGGVLTVLLEPAVIVFFVPLGVSMLIAGAMLNSAYAELQAAQIALLHAVRKAS